MCGQPRMQFRLAKFNQTRGIMSSPLAAIFLFITSAVSEDAKLLLGKLTLESEWDL